MLIRVVHQEWVEWIIKNPELDEGFVKYSPAAIMWRDFLFTIY